MKYLHMLKRISAIALCALAAGGIAVLADTALASYEDTVNGARAEIERIKAERGETEEMLENYKTGKRDILSSIEELDGKISDVTENMVNIRKKIKKNKENIDGLEQKIAASEQDIRDQYETMKKRIKYMYENGNSGYIEILLDSDSLSDLLNRSEYIEKISSYDANMLANYVEAKRQLEEKKQDLSDRRAVLLEEKKELKAQKKTLNKIMDKKNDELDTYNSNISDAKNRLGQYDNEIEMQDRIIEDALLAEQKRIAAEEQKKKEEEEARQKEKEQKEEEDGKDPDEEGETGDDEEDKKEEDGETDESGTEESGGSTVSTGGFIWPLPISGKITSSFGQRTSPTAGASSYHQGIDISAPAGTPILAAKAGTVVTASYSSASGNYIMINHGGGVFTVYMHASSLAVSMGQEVSAGTTIAYVGSTGVSTGSHLHFGVSVGGRYVNPLNYVSR